MLDAMTRFAKLTAQARREAAADAAANVGRRGHSTRTRRGPEPGRRLERWAANSPDTPAWDADPDPATADTIGA